MEKRKLERLSATIFQDPSRLARLRGGSFKPIGTQTACTFDDATAVPRPDGDFNEC